MTVTEAEPAARSRRRRNTRRTALVVAVLALLFGVVLHATPIGRGLYAMGNSPDAATFTGINVARTNANPAVRKRAMTFLGQSKDPRAIDFFESVLK